MKQTLKIYLADLVYTTISAQTPVFPLNIGFIASYCKKQFDSKVEITLFKYIDELEKAINESPPDILGLSNYVWNHRIGLEMFRILSQKNPHALKVWGGPNFPLDPEAQKIFLKQLPEVDIYVPVEGEIGFSNIIEKVLQIDSKEKIRETLFSNPIDNCVFLGSDDELKFTFTGNRLKNLNEIPSPYLTKTMDKFFDGRLSPMLQTNRGCPFTCSFCVDGADNVKQVNSFSLDRVRADIDYITEHTTKNMRDLEISDLNFGMYPRDQDICEHLAYTRKEKDFPHTIHVSTGKNQKEKIIKIIERLSGAIRLCMSVQTMDQEVLTNIKRENLSVDQMLALAPAIKNSGLNTASEVILGLPGETYESHLQTLNDLLRAKLDRILVYSCMMLTGSEMATSQERKKWGLKTKFRILVKDFTKLSNGKKVIEIEEIIVGSNVMSFNDYLRCREVDFAVFVTNTLPVFKPLLKFLRENNVDLIKIFSQTLQKLNDFPRIKKIFDEFKELTAGELWDSPEELEVNYQNDGEYQKLLDNESAFNIMFYSTGKLISEHIEEWVSIIHEISYDFLRENGKMNDILERQFLEIKNFAKCLTYNVFGNNRFDDAPQYDFEYDIQHWLENDENYSLDEFKFPALNRITFNLTQEQFTEVENNLNTYGKTIWHWVSPRKGMGFQELLQTFWRHPLIEKSLIQ